MATKVIFRKWKSDGTVIAFFPDEGTAYEHVGQSGAANWHVIRPLTRPATPNEYAELLEELIERSFGAEIKICSRRYRK